MNTMNTKNKIREVQKKLALTPDGIAGPKTWGAIYNKVVGVAVDKVGDWNGEIPKDTDSAISRVYGKPGDESNHSRMVFPYPMTYEGQPVKSTMVHRLAKGDLFKILSEIYNTFGMAYIKEHHLDHYAGCFNKRKTRGGSSWSRHSWAIAFDFAAEINGNRTRKPKADMPWEVIAIFEKYGWKSGGRAWGRDFMHFQRTKG